MKSSLRMVQLLLRHGADNNQTLTNRRPPLIWAVIHHDASLAEVLLHMEHAQLNMLGMVNLLILGL